MPMRDPQAVERGRQLRKAMTPPEIKLWYRLKNRQIDGLKFRRQASVGPYIADFLSHDAKLAVELEGDTHATNDAVVHDERRRRFFEQNGFRVVRFLNSEVREDIDYVVERIRLACGVRPAGES
jgi:very-short-patch-repair endonuclease